MRNFKWFVKVAVLITLFFVIEYVIGFILSPTLSYTRIAFHEMYTQEDNIDVVFLGASHTYRTFDPAVLDEELGVNTFNAGSSSQRAIDSYFLLKELLSINAPKQVVFELPYHNFNVFYKDNKRDISPVPFFILYDYMKPSVNKVQYFANGLSSDYWADILFQSYRYKADFKPEYVKNSIREKVIEPDYKNYAYPEYPNEKYTGKGFVYGNAGFLPNNIGMVSPYPWSNERIDGEAVSYFEKIVDLCNEHGTELILVTAPIPIASLISMQNYDEAHMYLDGLVYKNGLKYYDFNLVKQDVFARPDDYFYDNSHMNGKAAAKFSKMFATFLKEYEAGEMDADEYFYNSFDELWADVDYVAAVGLEQNGDDFTATSLQGKYVEAEYEFSVKQEEGGYEVLQPYSDKNIFQYHGGSDEYTVRVNARAAGSQDAYQEYWELIVKPIAEAE
ncbi:MAG: hypothetical protein RR504_06660 [Christensenellaceae bacterium]